MHCTAVLQHYIITIFLCDSKIDTREIISIVLDSKIRNKRRRQNPDLLVDFGITAVVVVDSAWVWFYENAKIKKNITSYRSTDMFDAVTGESQRNCGNALEEQVFLTAVIYVDI